MLDIAVGHAHTATTGTTAIVPAQPATAAVDIRGGGPGTRDTAALTPWNTVNQVHAILLTGGSAFGMATADSAMRLLADDGIGFEAAPGIVVPIVPTAVIFDLLAGSPEPPPADFGAEAIRAARRAPSTASGSLGAGVGAIAGSIRGGFGQATRPVTLPDGRHYTLSAYVVTNPAGSVVNPDTGQLWSAPQRVDPARLPARGTKFAHLNTTIGVVATDAPLRQTQAKRLAMAGHDAYARAIRPAHMPLDGDTVFALATTPPDDSIDILALSHLCAAAADTMETAIVNSILAADPCPWVPTFQELAP